MAIPLHHPVASSRPMAGGYGDEESAARAYDLAALKYWGPAAAATNFPVSQVARCQAVAQGVLHPQLARSRFVAH